MVSQHVHKYSFAMSYVANYRKYTEFWLSFYFPFPSLIQVMFVGDDDRSIGQSDQSDVELSPNSSPVKPGPSGIIPRQQLHFDVSSSELSNQGPSSDIDVKKAFIESADDTDFSQLTTSDQCDLGHVVHVTETSDGDWNSYLEGISLHPPITEDDYPNMCSTDKESFSFTDLFSDM